MKLDKTTIEHRLFVLIQDIEIALDEGDIADAKECVEESLHYQVKGTHYEKSKRWEETDLYERRKGVPV